MKTIAKDPNSSERHLHKENDNGKKDPLYLHRIIPHHAQTPYSMRQPPSQELNLWVNFTDPFATPDLNNFDKQKNLKNGMFKQLDNTKIQKRSKMLDERLKAI